MLNIRICCISFSLIGALAACAGKPGDSGLPAAGVRPDNRAMPVSLQPIIEAAMQDAASRNDIDRAAIEVVHAEPVTWPDGSMGCPAPGMQYTQALVPGYRVLLRAGNQTFDYHAAANGYVAWCPPGRAVDPVAGDRI